MKKSKTTKWRWNSEEQSGNSEENVGSDENNPEDHKRNPRHGKRTNLKPQEQFESIVGEQ
jgi:hypothetical protein